ncbi:MAG TPA: diaminopimelate decarboxylase [Candidatus Limnocylindria bacterium]|jgi:diaminopimelate decarboxylase|nr:diaminopimelate decarboxylase [Candidatus Limnocylindria bacterium]
MTFPADLFPDTTRLAGNRLAIGGCDLVALAVRYGTPLYVYDEATIRSRARAIRDAVTASYSGRATVCYAAKAYVAPWLLELIESEGLGLDVVSGGELHVAVVAKFPRDRIFFHGNNKTEDELDFALQQKIARIVVDNLDEVAPLGRLAAAYGMKQPVLLRVGPRVETDTHAHLLTGATDTKFGLDIASGAAAEGVRAILAQPSLDLRGLHAHIGSQIRDLEAYRAAVGRVFAFAAAMRETTAFVMREMSPGGGYAVRYTPDDPAVDVAEMVRAVAGAVSAAAKTHRFDPPDLTLEPGRSIIAPAGVALYRVGSVKKGARTYVAVDGGMSDNIRPTAYGAQYTAALANRVNDGGVTNVAIAGKYCETGDILIQKVALPLPRVGDLVAVPVSGAYQLAMASNYNMARRPAVVAVADGASRLVTARETHDQLMTRETPP